jgi:hypothetical protein
MIRDKFSRYGRDNVSETGLNDSSQLCDRAGAPRDMNERPSQAWRCYARYPRAEMPLLAKPIAVVRVRHQPIAPFTQRA